jgi:hypothetical protein
LRVLVLLDQLPECQFLFSMRCAAFEWLWRYPIELRRVAGRFDR